MKETTLPGDPQGLRTRQCSPQERTESDSAALGGKDAAVIGASAEHFQSVHAPAVDYMRALRRKTRHAARAGRLAARLTLTAQSLPLT